MQVGGDLFTLLPGLRHAALYGVPFVALYVLLTVRVIRLRRGRRIGLGHGNDPELQRAIRAHGNFCETAPMFLALLALLVLAGAPAWVVHVSALPMVIGRVLHAWGLAQTAGSSVGRVAGMTLTFFALMFAALALLWLGGVGGRT